MKWRYFPFKYYDIYQRIALNDVVLEYVKNTQNGVVSFTGWNSNCVNIGYSQKIRDVINLEEVEKNNINIVRRKSSGGVTFLSKFDLCWGITVPEHFFEGKNLQEIYLFATSKIISALSKLGIEARHKPINDVVTDLGKISGSALRKDNGVIQLHGTFLFDVDKKLLDTILRPELDHQKKEKIKEVDKRVTSISKLSDVSFNRLKTILAEEFLLGLDYFEKPFTDDELNNANKKVDLIKDRNWIFKF